MGALLAISTLFTPLIIIIFYKFVDKKMYKEVVCIMEFPDKTYPQPQYGEIYEVEESFMGVFAIWQRFYHLKGFDQIKPDGRRVCFNTGCFIDITNLQDEINEALTSFTPFRGPIVVKPISEIDKHTYRYRDEDEPKANLLTLKCQLKAAMLVLQNSKDPATQQKALTQIDQLIIKMQKITG